MKRQDPKPEYRNELLTTQDLVEMFGRTELTISNWREQFGLPYVVIPGNERDAIRFRENKVRKWAERQGVPIVK